ncbi:MAG: hypothetical protein LBU65_00115 [Planctomycetaceae bacterium]|jgi:hypothetical protein|nr:hypothetical protein [Planctomycetaceae bacterium]
MSKLSPLLLVIAVFYLYGGWAIPDLNEPYYICKAIHYWQPNWIPADTFLESRDAHWFYYIVFGTTSFFLTPYMMALVGRLICWSLMAWGWCRLSQTLLCSNVVNNADDVNSTNNIIPLIALPVFTAAVFLFYQTNFNLAGEWVAGGVEGKTFAFGFIFFAFDAMCRSRWRQTWLLLGIASAFHVLAGGWSVICALLAWLFLQRNERPKFITMLPALICGGILSLPGLLPALRLNADTPADIVAQSNDIYVFFRLSHHLVPSQIAWTMSVRFLLMTAVWILLVSGVFYSVIKTENGSNDNNNETNLAQKTMARFVAASLLLAFIGCVIDILFSGNVITATANRPLAAKLLRYYWFRTSDWAVPLGLTFTGTRFLFMLATPVWVYIGNVTIRQLTGLIFSLTLIALVMFLVVHAVLFGNFSWTTQPDAKVVWMIITVCVLHFTWVSINGYRLYPELSENANGVKRFAALLLTVMLIVMLFLTPLLGLFDIGGKRTTATFAKAEPLSPYTAFYWLDICNWIRENTPTDAKFLVPRDMNTFKWNASRSDIGVLKEIPQDAASIVKWERTMNDLFSYKSEEGETKWDRSITMLFWWKTDKEAIELQQKYKFNYIVCPSQPDLSHKKYLEQVYKNDMLAVYSIRKIIKRS